MVRRLAFGALWGIVIYFGACILTGGIAGGIAGGEDPENAIQAGANAGAKAVSALRLYYLWAR